MKEYIISVPEESEQVVTAVMEKFGVKTTELKKRKVAPKKSFDIDPKTLREQSWRRS